jgi:hypothetical protein
MACSSLTTRVRVRTTPLTWGSQASVATRIRIGRRASRGAVIASRSRRSDLWALGGSLRSKASDCIQAQKAPSSASLVGK